MSCAYVDVTLIGALVGGLFFVVIHVCSMSVETVDFLTHRAELSIEMNVISLYNLLLCGRSLVHLTSRVSYVLR